MHHTCNINYVHVDVVLQLLVKMSEHTNICYDHYTETYCREKLDYKETTILNLETTTIHRCEHFLKALQAPEATC